MSSVEQLKQNVAATLESTGVLARIRAELRAEVFAAIEMQKPSGVNIPQKVDEFARNEFGRQSIDLVVEFLQFFGLKHTLAVFKAETHRPDADVNRDSLWDAISSTKSEFSLRKPLLVALLEHNRRSPPDDDARPEHISFTEGRTSASRRSEAQTTTTAAALPETAIVYHAEPQNSSSSQLSTLIAASEPKPGDASSLGQENVTRRRGLEPMPAKTPPLDSEPARSSARAAPEAQFGDSVKREANPPASSSVHPESTLSLTVPAAKEVKSGMTEQLHQIDDLLKQLDTKQKLTDLAKAQLKADSHHLVEDLSDNDDVEFDDDDFEYEPDDVAKDDCDELFPGFSSKPADPVPRHAIADNTVECFSDDPSADEGALDAFDVVHEVRLLSQRTV